MRPEIVHRLREARLEREHAERPPRRDSDSGMVRASYVLITLPALGLFLAGAALLPARGIQTHVLWGWILLLVFTGWILFLGLVTLVQALLGLRREQPTVDRRRFARLRQGRSERRPRQGLALGRFERRWHLLPRRSIPEILEHLSHPEQAERPCDRAPPGSRRVACVFLRREVQAFVLPASVWVSWAIFLVVGIAVLTGAVQLAIGVGMITLLLLPLALAPIASGSSRKTAEVLTMLHHLKSVKARVQARL